MIGGRHRMLETCMSLVEEYRRRFEWREWAGALSRCPASPGLRILDLGCGGGDVSRLLASHGLGVTGVDANPELLAAARERYPECRFERQDLRELEFTMGSFDGLWCSFTAAISRRRSRGEPSCSSQKRGVCVVEADDLLGNEPLSASTRRQIEAFYQEASTGGRYNFPGRWFPSSRSERRGFPGRRFGIDRP